MKPVSAKHGLLSLTISGVLFPGLIYLKRTFLDLDWYFVDHSIFDVIQELIAFCAIATGLILFIICIARRQRNLPQFLPRAREGLQADRPYLPWITASLIVTGLLTGFCSTLSVVDDRYLWGELVAQVLAGIFILGVWCPPSFSLKKSVSWGAPLTAIALGTLSGALLLLYNFNLPPLIKLHYFSPLYSTGSGLAGLGFLAATWYFVLRIKREQRISDVVFAHYTLLSGMSDFVSEKLHLWGPIWWSWHLLQMAAMVIIFSYVFAMYFRLETALQESEARFEILAESVFEGALVIEKGVVYDTNLAFEEISGYAESEIVGRDCNFFFSSTLPLLETAAPVERKLIRKNQDELDVEVRCRRFYQGTGLIYTVHDITAQKKQQEKLRILADELRRSNRELEQFAQLASHDLREPLRMVSAFLSLLKNRFGGTLPPEAHEYIGFAVDGASRMQGLVEGLLQYAKSCRDEVKSDRVASRDIVQSALRDLKIAITESNASITYDNLPVVFCDAIQLRRVFENLIQNAIKYRSAEAPRIHIAALEQHRDWRFELSDNGIGIPEEFQEKIFELFVRGPGGERQDGVGMGLAACKAIVERHGGTIGVRRRSEGGSCFYFTVPKKEEPPLQRMEA